MTHHDSVFGPILFVKSKMYTWVVDSSKFCDTHLQGISGLDVITLGRLLIFIIHHTVNLTKIIGHTDLIRFLYRLQWIIRGTSALTNANFS